MSIFESPGSLWEPSGVDLGASGVDSGASGVEFEPPGADFGPIWHKSGHKAQNVKKNRVRHGPLGV